MKLCSISLVQAYMVAIQNQSICREWPQLCCKSKTGRHNQDRSRRATNHRRILTRPVSTVATGLGFATRPWYWC